MSSQGDSEGGGCAALIVGIIVLAIVVAVLISIAAIIDPFSWLPPVGDIWADCDDDYATERDECDLATRFPGFWGHAVVNLVYVVVAVVAVLAALGCAFALREARSKRFDSAEAVAAYTKARREFAGMLALALICGLAPLVVAAA
jgi:hypothetical protein